MNLERFEKAIEIKRNLDAIKETIKKIEDLEIGVERKVSITFEVEEERNKGLFSKKREFKVPVEIYEQFRLIVLDFYSQQEKELQNQFDQA